MTSVLRHALESSDALNSCLERLSLFIDDAQVDIADHDGFTGPDHGTHTHRIVHWTRDFDSIVADGELGERELALFIEFASLDVTLFRDELKDNTFSRIGGRGANGKYESTSYLSGLW
ncbi:MAG: hypothetical protein VYC04_05995 [Actinomycetota bacterium]|nr:hypothetical protein [Actinomycetota bacterium]